MIISHLEDGCTFKASIPKIAKTMAEYLADGRYEVPEYEIALSVKDTGDPAENTKLMKEMRFSVAEALAMQAVLFEKAAERCWNQLSDRELEARAPVHREHVAPAIRFVEADKLPKRCSCGGPVVNGEKSHFSACSDVNVHVPHWAAGVDETGATVVRFIP